MHDGPPPGMQVVSGAKVVRAVLGRWRAKRALGRPLLMQVVNGAERSERTFGAFCPLMQSICTKGLLVGAESRGEGIPLLPLGG